MAAEAIITDARLMTDALSLVELLNLLTRKNKLSVAVNNSRSYAREVSRQGMKFEFKPSLWWPLGYPLALTLTLGSAFGIMISFRRRQWLCVRVPPMRPLGPRHKHLR